jgi:hypothetical protein
MYLIPVPNLPPVFSIQVKSPKGSIYKANVTTDTTVELLLKYLNAYLKNERYNYKLAYREKDVQNIDTLKKLYILVGVICRRKMYTLLNANKLIILLLFILSET